MIKKTSQEWLLLVESWQSSTVSQREFCKEHNVALSGFQYWLRKARKRSSHEEDLPSTSTGFVPVSIKPAHGSLPNHRSALLELILPDGRRVNFYEGIDVQFLRALLS